jgi:AAA domain-containing protein
VLVVDEAHKLPRELLEEIRLLGNFENPEQKLLQIVLAGQPELSDVLNRDEMRQFKQRIAVRLRIEPLCDEEVRTYVQCRWKEAGGPEPLPFEHEALSVIAMCASGIPRLINSVCDNSLMWAFAEESKYVLAQHAWNAASDLDLVVPGALPTAASRVPVLLPQAAWPSPAVERPVPPAPAIAPFREPPSKNGNGSNGAGSKPWWNRWTVRLGNTG